MCNIIYIRVNFTEPSKINFLLHLVNREAQKVLMALHMAPPLFLRVSFGYSIENGVNSESIYMHNEIRRQLKENSSDAVIDASKFKSVSSTFPENNLEPETRLQLIDFSE